MKTHQFNFAICIILLSSCASKAQSDQGILKMLDKRFLNINTYELIFLEPELIDFCKDSVGQNKIIKRINEHKKLIELKQDMKSKTDLIALNILLRRVKQIQAIDQDQKRSKDFLEDQLQSFSKDFQLNEKIASDLFDENKRDKSTKEVCDVGISMYLIFVIDPQLYIKVLKKNREINPDGKIYFPLKCTIEEFDKPLPLRKRMQSGLLEVIKKIKNSELETIKNSIEKANVSGSYD